MIVSDSSKGSKKSKSPKSSKGSKGTKGSKRSKSKDEPLPDPGIWTHYNNLAQHISCLHVYFKPSKMKTTIIITDIGSSAKGKSINKLTKESQDSSTHCQRIHWLNDLKKTHNQPFYLFMDDMECEFIVLNLSHVGNKMPEKIIKQKDMNAEERECHKAICLRGSCEEYCICQDKGILSESDVSDFIDTRTTGSVCIEKYNWTRKSMGDRLIFFNTYGTKSVTRDYCGRNIWKIWLNSDTNLVFTILSDVEVTIGTIEDILDHMAKESDTILKSTYTISNAFGELIKNFGTPEFGQFLKLFYKSYIPETELTKAEVQTSHECFMQEFLNMLSLFTSESDKNTYIRALRVLFLNPYLKFPNHKMFPSPRKRDRRKTSDFFCICIDPDEKKRDERAAVKIQNFFKMIYVKKLKEKHDYRNAAYASVYDTLRNIHLTMFSNKNINTAGPSLLRSFVNNEDMSAIRCLYPYYNDLENVVILNRYTGTITSGEKRFWIPLARVVFTCDQETLIKIYLNCDLAEYVLRVFDNSTNEEIERYANNSIVATYKENDTGYTAFAYAWTELQKLPTKKWTISIIRQKLYPDFKVTFSNVHLQTINVIDGYIPNKDNKIFKYKITVSDNTVTTFRVEAGCENVKINLKITSDKGETINEITCSNSIAFIPATYLNASWESESVVSLSRSESVKSPSPVRSPSKYRSSIYKKRPSHSRKDDERSVSTLDHATSRSNIRRKESVKAKKIPNIYYAEAFVLEDTWPLTETEWARVDERRKKWFIEEEIIKAHAPRYTSPFANFIHQFFKKYFCAKLNPSITVGGLNPNLQFRKKVKPATV